MEILKTEGLKKYYGNMNQKGPEKAPLVKALDGVDLSVENGEFVAVVGTSGSGKSTLLHMMGGLDRPTEGRVEVAGKDIFSLTDDELTIFRRRKIGFIFQSYNLVPVLNVYENIALPVELDGQRPDGEYMDRIIKTLGLEEKIHNLPNQLSGGQQQRVALARILASQPDVLLLDEPFSAMDAYLKEGLRLELSRVLERCQKPAVLVTHDRDEAYQLCQYLLLMDRGKVIARGKTKELFNNPGSCQAARLTGCKNISRIRILGDYQVQAVDWGGLELTVGQPVTEDVTAVGIRAHDFMPLSSAEAKARQGQAGANLIPVMNPRISQMPFEWQITMENGLWWKREKGGRVGDGAGEVPKWLTVDPADVLLLRG